MLTSGFGTVSECSRKRVPRAPQNNTTFMMRPSVPDTSIAPEQVLVDLSRLFQIAQLFQPRECAELIRVLRHLDAPEQLVELLRAAPRAPLRPKSGQLLGNLPERDAIAACIACAGADTDLATRKNAGDDRGDVPNAVVLGIRA